MMNRSSDVISLPSARPDLAQSYSASDFEISEAIRRAQENLLRQQKDDGDWCGELIVDSTGAARSMGNCSGAASSTF